MFIVYVKNYVLSIWEKNCLWIKIAQLHKYEQNIKTT